MFFIMYVAEKRRTASLLNGQCHKMFLAHAVFQCAESDSTLSNTEGSREKRL